jgi:hypothetical protein
LAQDKEIKELKSTAPSGNQPFSEAVTSLQTVLKEKEQEIDAMKVRSSIY